MLITNTTLRISDEATTKKLWTNTTLQIRGCYDYEVINYWINCFRSTERPVRLISRLWTKIASKSLRFRMKAQQCEQVKTKRKRCRGCGPKYFATFWFRQKRILLRTHYYHELTQWTILKTDTYYLNNFTDLESDGSNVKNLGAGLFESRLTLTKGLTLTEALCFLV